MGRKYAVVFTRLVKQRAQVTVEAPNAQTAAFLAGGRELDWANDSTAEPRILVQRVKAPDPAVPPLGLPEVEDAA